MFWVTVEGRGFPGTRSVSQAALLGEVSRPPLGGSWGSGPVPPGAQTTKAS